MIVGSLPDPADPFDPRDAPAEVSDLALRAGESFAVAACAAWNGLVALRARILDPLARDFEAASGLPLAGFHALELLAARPSGQRMAELADALGFTRGGTSKVIGRLEAAGLVERSSPAGDRRAIYAQITPRGLELLAALGPLHRRLVVERLAPYLDGGDLAPLTRLATRLTTPR